MNKSDVVVKQRDRLDIGGYEVRLDHMPTEIFVKGFSSDIEGLMSDLYNDLQILVHKKENPSVYAYC